MHKLLHWGDQLNWIPVVCLVVASLFVFLTRMLTVWFFARRLSAVRGASEAEMARILAELLATRRPVVPSVVSSLYFLSGVVLIVVTLWGLVSTAWWMLPLGCLSWIIVHRPFMNEMQVWSQMQSTKMTLEDTDALLNEANDEKKTFLVLNYKAGRSALVDLPSGEQIVISIGTATAKVIAKRAIVGWYLPKVVASERLDTWQPEFRQFNELHRRINRDMFLDGVLASLSQCRSIDDIRRAWPTMQNPILVVAKEKLDIHGHKSSA